jgi:tetratricopeptide (TPR) repeat protein
VATEDIKPAAILVVELAARGDPETSDDSTDDPRAGLTALRPLIAEHDGKAVDMPGRRLAVQFSSAFAAVSCAVALQRAPVGDGGTLRIGVDFGSAISNGETIVGDGVYVAARLQEMADPGNVCVSGAIYDRVTGRSGIGFETLGTQSLSDRAEAVRIYRVEPEPDDTRRESEASPLPDTEHRLSLAAPELDSAGQSTNVNAERQVQRGFWLYNRNNETDTKEAERLFWGALDADPQCAAAAAGIAACLLLQRQRGWTADPGRVLVKADAVARRAVALAPKYAYGRIVLGEVSLFRNDLDKGSAEAAEALRLQPALADGHTLIGLVRLCDGAFDDAVTSLEHALVRDPSERQQIKALPALAAAYYQLKRYPVAERVALRAWGLARDHWMVRQILAASRGQLGYESGAPIIAGIRNDETLLTRRDFAARLYYREAAWRHHVEDGLRKAGWDDF